jgi:hypothetical protein
MSVLFAATHPERTSALILYGAMARTAWAPDNPWGRTDEGHFARLKFVEEHWGKSRSVEVYAPSLAGNEEYVRWAGRHERAAASPGAALAIVQMNQEIDVRHVLPTISVPTLVMHRIGDRPINVEHGRYCAKHIPRATYLDLPGDDHMPWAGDADTLCQEVQAFLTGVRSGPEPDRVFTTVLFTDRDRGSRLERAPSPTSLYCADVVHPLLKCWNSANSVRESSTSLVEADQPAKGGQALKKAYWPRILQLELEMGNETGH